MFLLGYAAGFSDGVAFTLGTVTAVVVAVLVTAYVLYRSSDGWSKWRGK